LILFTYGVYWASRAALAFCLILGVQVRGQHTRHLRGTFSICLKVVPKSGLFLADYGDVRHCLHILQQQLPKNWRTSNIFYSWQFRILLPSDWALPTRVRSPLVVILLPASAKTTSNQPTYCVYICSVQLNTITLITLISLIFRESQARSSSLRGGNYESRDCSF
jgi:hypothetical protein